ncbi:hypothetical protein NE237_028977 [Protea cynaroides]|uniref:Uncharacterized protein n=1 Tax=Protea cynaroides TaxID=273540 RepID=A0A9Q0JVN6_9MAGN|nr:hypothetical protein NE237_028977 [Protea cynaroides]
MSSTGLQGVSDTTQGAGERRSFALVVQQTSMPELSSLPKPVTVAGITKQPVGPSNTSSQRYQAERQADMVEEEDASEEEEGELMEEEVETDSGRNCRNLVKGFSFKFGNHEESQLQKISKQGEEARRREGGFVVVKLSYTSEEEELQSSFQLQLRKRSATTTAINLEEEDQQLQASWWSAPKGRGGATLSGEGRGGALPSGVLRAKGQQRLVGSARAKGGAATEGGGTVEYGGEE